MAKKVNLLKHAALILVVAGTALIGVLALKGSFAATGATLTVHAVEVDSNGAFYQHLSGVLVYVRPGSCSAYPGNGNPLITPPTGVANFGTCTVGPQYCLELDKILRVGYTLVDYTIIPSAVSTTNKGGGCAQTSEGGLIPFLISFKRNPTPITLNVSASAISAGDAVTVSWSAPSATYCVKAGAWGTGVVGASGSLPQSPGVPSANYTLNCVSAGTSYAVNGIGANSVTKTVTVSARPAPPANSNSGGSGSSSSGSSTTTKPNDTKPKPADVAAVVSSDSGDTTSPDKPSDFEATFNEDDPSVSLTWSAATDNVGVTSYLLERSTDALEWENIAEPSETTYSDDALPPEASYYYYRVRAKDAAGNLSEAVFADVENEVARNSSADGDEAASSAPGTESDNATSPGMLPVAMKAGGGLLLLVVLVVAVAWYRRLRGGESAPSVVVTPAPADLAPPHASQSLKDMVMQDFHPGQTVNPSPPSQQSPQQAPSAELPQPESSPEQWPPQSPPPHGQ